MSPRSYASRQRQEEATEIKEEQVIVRRPSFVGSEKSAVNKHQQKL